MTLPTPELVQSLKERLKITYALDETQKQEILWYIDSLQTEQIEAIFDTIAGHERLIVKDSLNYEETNQQTTDKISVEQELDDLIF